MVRCVCIHAHVGVCDTGKIVYERCVAMNPGAADVCNVVQSRVLCLDGFELKPKTRLAGKPSDSCSDLPGVPSDMSLL